MEWLTALPVEIKILACGIILALIVYAVKKTYPDAEQPATALNPADQARINADFETALRDKSEKWGKKFAVSYDEARRNRGEVMLRIMVYLFGFVVLAVIVGMVIRFLDESKIIKPSVNVVGSNDTCIRSNGTSWDKLPEGTEILAGDECNGKVIEPTIIAPTSTPTQVVVLQPTNQVTVVPTTTSVEVEVEKFVILPITNVSKQITTFGFKEVPNPFAGYHILGEAQKCGAEKITFKLEEQYQTAFIHFEGGRNIFFADTIINVGNTVVEVSGDSISLSNCNGYFSLWVK